MSTSAQHPRRSLNARPYGWIQTLGGNPMPKQLAGGLLRSIRLEIARGKAPFDAVAPYLTTRAKSNLVAQRYQDWLAVKRQQVEAGDLSPRTLGEYERFARPGGEVDWWRGLGVAEVDYATMEDWLLWMASPTGIERVVLGRKSPD